MLSLEPKGNVMDEGYFETGRKVGVSVNYDELGSEKCQTTANSIY